VPANIKQEVFQICREGHQKLDEKGVNFQFISYFMRKKRLKHSAAAGDKGPKQTLRKAA
jgi:hypothetical protein